MNFLLGLIWLQITFYEISADELKNGLKDLNNNEDNILRIGFLAHYKSSKVILGAMPLAVDYVNNDKDLLPGKTLEYCAVNICSDGPISAQSIRNMTDLFINRGVVAFIGPDESCSHEAIVASAWNLPMISYSCADLKVTNKTLFPTFARTSLGPPDKISKSVVALLKYYDWNKFIIISDSRQWTMEITLAIKDLVWKNYLNVTDIVYFSDYIRSKYRDMQKIVSETFRRTRIYVFVGGPWALDDFMLGLQERKLIDSGDYMVISVNDEFYNPDSKHSQDTNPNILNHPFLSRYKNKALTTKTYQSILQITLTAPTVDLSQFNQDIIEKAKEIFKVPLHGKIKPVISVRAAYLYDAVIMYSQALTKWLKDGGDPKDGKEMMQKYIFKNFYTSKQGFQVFIDENGNAEGNFSVFSMQYINETSGSKSMQQVGSFVSSSNDDELPNFSLITPILWINGFPPKTEPKCGFEGCSEDWSFIVSCLFVVLFVILVSAFLIKHYRYEHKLACLLWKICLSEVTFLGQEYNDEAFQNRNLSHFIRQRTMSFVGEQSSRKAHTTIGFYRGNIVALKKVHKRSVDLTRNIKKELKLIRELRHENIVSFVGASIETSNIFIITNYCARGSLENVLANPDLKLDLMFISSLVFDIVKGLIHLHDSEIVSHGNLRTSNCLIDSRWCLKLTDFGLHEFKHGNDEPDKDEKEIKRSLYRAPELLRLQNSPPNGTQRGDVYSFSIVLYEIYGRKGPFGIGSSANDSESLSTYKEIKAKILNPPNPMVLIRPPLYILDAPECVKQTIVICWTEEPENRPEMRLVRLKLKGLQSGHKSDIFDNMMSLMEKYSFQLEELVQERTNLLVEEKKKSENLLLRMLPRSVAESLIRGEQVVAENFDCVTILFCDLVGFTEICSRSSALEVVDMLNDLYSIMDSIISNYDCYKVETIGDAYMVVSGLPIRNTNHAGMIASLALTILDRVSKLEIRHRPGELFKIRMGIHSGQVVAGVVGFKMPRYCLFGDTVNCASRMESTSEPLKIHISFVTYSLLNKIGGFKAEERGMTFIKGKGELKTFWLLSQNSSIKVEDKIIRKNVKNNCSFDDYYKAPDLLSFTRKSTKSLSDILNGTTMFGAFSDQQLVDDPLPSLNISKNFPSHDCYLCQKRKYLFEKYHKALKHHCTKETLNLASSLSISSDGDSLANGCCSCSKEIDASYCKQ